MSFWSTLRRWLGLAQQIDPEETEQAFELASGVASDVVTLVSAGVTPAGAVAAVRTVQDVARGVRELQSDGTVPMPLSAKDVQNQQAQIASAARPLPPPKPPTPGRQ